MTLEDLEDLAYEASPAVARAIVLPGVVTNGGGEVSASSLSDINDRDGAKIGPVRVLIVPWSVDEAPKAGPGLLREVEEFLRARCPPTLKFHVTGPKLVAVHLTVNFHPEPDADVEAVRGEMVAVARRFLDPIRGGEGGLGWDTGHVPQMSDIVRVLGSVRGVDYIFPNVVTTPESIDSETLIYPGSIIMTAQGAGMSMDLQRLSLDDKTYDELLREAIDSLPALNPSWTDHNPSDPGIVLIELLAWLIEMMIYRTGQVSESTRQAFMRLLTDPAVLNDPAKAAALDPREVLGRVRDPFRAVTREDYESLARSVSNAKRVHCLVDYDGATRSASPGHVSLVVLPEKEGLRVKTELAGRHLIATVFHVIEPSYQVLDITAKINLSDEATRLPDPVKYACETRLINFLHPLYGGSLGAGWPLGREVRDLEVMAQLDTVPGVSSVSEVTITPHPNSLMCGDTGLVRYGNLSLTYFKRTSTGWEDL